MRELVGQLGTYLSVSAEARNLAYSVQMSPDVPVALIGDVSKIRQIVVNLLSNATKYTDEGRVDLVVDHALDRAQGRYVLSFAVIDTGIGLADKDMAIFSMPMVAQTLAKGMIFRAWVLACQSRAV